MSRRFYPEEAAASSVATEARLAEMREDAGRPLPGFIGADTDPVWGDVVPPETSASDWGTDQAYVDALRLRAGSAALSPVESTAIEEL